jgi:midasin (ATPase involved in ribosome maturation)
VYSGTSANTEETDFKDEEERIEAREIPLGNRKEEQEAFDDNDDSDDLDCEERRPEGGLLDDICKQHISKVSMRREV